MITLTLTPRRQETLDTLRRLNQQGGAAVHYSLVATRMKISAWTAYSLLRELEKAGLVARSYALEPGRRLGGRSRILFAAIDRAQPGRIEEVEAALRAAFERFSAIADEAAAGQAYLKETGADLAYQLGFWLSRLETAGRGAHDAARTILDGSAGPRLKVQALAAMGLGASLARLQRGQLAGRMTAAAGRFTALLEGAGRASDAQLGLLVEAARQIGTGAPRRHKPAP